MQHTKTTHIVLIISTALCSLYKTAYAVLIGKHPNIYTCAHTYTSCRSMRKAFKNSMMTLFGNSMMILSKNSMIILLENSMIILFEDSMMKLFEICKMIIHTGDHILWCIIWFMRQLQKNSKTIKHANSIMNISALALLFYTALCGFHKAVYAEYDNNQHNLYKILC